MRTAGTNGKGNLTAKVTKPASSASTTTSGHSVWYQVQYLDANEMPAVLGPAARSQAHGDLQAADATVKC